MYRTVLFFAYFWH